MVEWEQIPPPPSAPAPSTGAWSTKIVFPPVNHEGLHHIFSSPHEEDVKQIHLQRGFPPLPSPLPTPRPVGDNATGGWWESGIELLRFKVASIVSSFRKFAAARGFPTSFRTQPGYGLPLAGAIMFLLLYLRFRRRRRMQKESISDLIRVVREKDEA